MKKKQGFTLVSTTSAPVWHETIVYFESLISNSFDKYCV